MYNSIQVVYSYNIPQNISNNLSDSVILRKSLYEAGIESPPYPNQAHHIVAVTAKEAKFSRDVLDCLNIDLNSATNGILLPSDTYAAYVVTESRHSGGHLLSYYIDVNNEIRDTLIAINPAWELESDEKLISILKSLPESQKEKIRFEICSTIKDIKIELLEGEIKVQN